MKRTEPAEAIAPRHAVKFYSDDESLFETVARFLAPGLLAGQPALLITTSGHTAGILAELNANAVDLTKARASGRFILLDAENTLATFMRGNTVDPAAFQREIGSVLDALLRRQPDATIGAFGEMVDVLWQRKQADAAIRLEILWNKLAVRYGFGLLCGYSIGNFFKRAAQYDRVCQLHSHVLPHESQPGI